MGDIRTEPPGLNDDATLNREVTKEIEALYQASLMPTSTYI